MRTSFYAIALGLLTLPLSTGCNPNPSNDESSSSGPCADGGLDTGCSGTTTTSSEGESEETQGDSSDSLTTSELTTDSEGDGDTDGSCVEDEDCPDGQVCFGGHCEDECGEAQIQLDLPPPPVMLVLDKSGSMVTNSWDHDGDAMTPDETRWATLHRVTDSILTDYEGGIQFGLQLFPQSNATAICANDASCPACSVASAPEVGMAIDNRDAVLGAMPASTANDSVIQGATPAASGMVSAKAALDAAVAAGEEGPAIILITDGAANCGIQYQGELCSFPGDGTSASCKLMDYFDDELETLVADYYAAGVPTYVVGIDINDEVIDPTSNYDFKVDNTNVYTELSAIALAGGVPPDMGVDPFYNATNEAELDAAMDKIVGELTECYIDLSEPPNMIPAPAQIPFVQFEMQNMAVPFLEISEADCLAGTEDGWIWVDLGVEVLFCGAYCDTLKTTLEVDGVYGCPPPG